MYAVLFDFIGYVMSAATVLASELGDRTMIATAAFAAARGEFVRTVAVSVAAFTLANLPVVLAGTLISKYLNLMYLRLISAVLFITVGLIIILSKREAGIIGREASLTLFFTTILLSELGDKSQLTLLSLTLIYGCLPALTGAITAYAAVNIASAAILNKLVSRYLSTRKALSVIKYATGSFFIVSGVVFLFVANVL